MINIHNNEIIVLELPTEEYKSRANEFKEDFFNNNEKIIHGSALFDQLDYKNWLPYNKNNRKSETVHKDWVVTTTFFGIRKSDNKIVSMIDIRHNLNNEFLKNYGGHIGYSVRPSERKKGYATQMLKLALDYAKSLNLTKVMLSCDSSNLASIKTITKCGGEFTDSKSIDGRTMNIYWIDL